MLLSSVNREWSIAVSHKLLVVKYTLYTSPDLPSFGLPDLGDYCFGKHSFAHASNTSCFNSFSTVSGSGYCLMIFSNIQEQ